jgi:hypothetical protein
MLEMARRVTHRDTPEERGLEFRLISSAGSG